MDTNFLYYKKFEGNVLPIDYVSWAYKMLENGFSSPSLNILSSLEEPFNIFEVEQFLKRVITELKLTEPSYEESTEGYVQYLLHQIILDNESAINSAYEIYKVLREYFDYDNPNLVNWYEISEMIDDFRYGNNAKNISKECLIKIIVQEANTQLEKN